MHENHLRMAELWALHKQKKMTSKQYDELHALLDWNMARAHKQALLFNQSYMAHVTGDTKWQTELKTRRKDDE